MLYLSKLRARLRAFFRKSRLEDEMSEELRFHLERQIEDNVRAGMNREEARYAALRAFGGVEQVKEICRDARGIRFIEELGQDLRYGLRMLRKSPGFTVVAVVTLALGIGANTAIFSLIDAVMLRMLAVRNPHELVALSSYDRTRGERDNFSYPGFEMYREAGSRLFDGIFAFADIGNLNVGYRGAGETASGFAATGSVHAVLGLAPAVGRLFGIDEDRAEGCCPVAVLSHPYWQSRFGRDPEVVGQTIHLNGRPFTIVGVTPKTFRGISFGSAPDVTIPLTMKAAVRGGASELRNGGNWWLRIIARTKPGVTYDEVRTTLEPTFARTVEHLLASLPASMVPDISKFIRNYQLAVESASRGAFSNARKDLSNPLLALMATVGLLLLIAGANVASLLVTRARARRREIAVRLAIGAGRGRLVRQLMAESMLVAVAGGAAGLLVAAWTGPALVTLLTDEATRAALDLRMDWRVFAFATLLSLATGIAFGLAPAVGASHTGLNLALKGATAGAGRTTQARGGKLLVAGQLALSLTLVVAAGLFVRTLQNLEHLDPGYRREKALLFSMDPRLLGYPDARLRAFYKDLLTRLEAIPAVQRATLSIHAMGRLRWTTLAEVPGFEAVSPQDKQVGRNNVGPRFFEAMGMTLVAGRDFGDQDSESSRLVAVVNESFARHFFGHENPIGKRFSLLGQPRRTLEIVGVVKDARDRGVREPPQRVVYTPYLQEGGLTGMTFAVRTAIEPTALTAEVRNQVRALDPGVSLFGIRTLDQQTREELARERLVATLASSFGIVALALSCLGLYGVLSYAVVQRTAEIGVRLTLGAGRGDVVWLVLRETLLLVAAGLAAGIPAALAVAHLFSGLLFALSPADPANLAGSALVLSLVAILAGYLPARRASRVDPMVALRCE